MHQKLQIEVITNLLDEVWPDKLDEHESLKIMNSITNYLCRTALNDYWDEQECNSAKDIAKCRNIHLELLGMKVSTTVYGELQNLPLDNEGDPVLIEREGVA